MGLKLTKLFQETRRDGSIAALSGVLYFLGFCGFDQFYLSWICLVPILWVLQRPGLTTRHALLYAWIFGFTTHLGGYTWIIHLLENFAYLPTPVALGLYALLCLAQGSLLAGWGWSVFLLHKHRGVPFIISGPLLMIAFEWLYPALFPSYLANSQYQVLPLIQSADLWGVLGISGLLTLSSCVCTQWLVHFFGPRAPAESTKPGALLFAGTGVFIALFSLNLGYGFFSLEKMEQALKETDERLKIGLVQTNMGIFEKRSKPREGLRRHREQSQQLDLENPDLIVWSESGYYFPINATTTDLSGIKGQIKAPLLFGGIKVDNRNGTREIYNSAFLTDESGTLIGTYDKTYLLAFGEYLPLGDLLPWLYKLSPNTSHFFRGQHTRPLELNGIRYGILICYEDILPRFVQKVMKGNPQVLINMTNDAWFGDSHEPIIHLALAIFRSVEQRRYLVRATNTGISAIVSPTGKIEQETPIFERANLLGDIAPLSDRTFYSKWGDWVGYLSLLILGGLSIGRRRSRS